MTSPDPASHPRLFWSASERQGLRAKATVPALALLQDRVLARCEHYLDPAHPLFIDNGQCRTDWVGAVPNCGRHWPKLSDLILADLLTDDPRWSGALAGALRVLTRDASPLMCHIFAHAPVTHHDGSLLGGRQRCFSTQCGMVPLMLDLLWDRLPPDDREAACTFLTRDTVDPFLAYLLDSPTDAAFAMNLGVNLGWWEFYAWVWSFAAVFDSTNERHRRGMDAVIRRIRHGLHLASDEAGVIGEGAGYAGIEIFGWWSSAEILRRLGLCDLWKEDERFLQVMKGRLYYQLPGGHGTLDHGDTDRHNGWHLNSLLVMLLHGQRTGDPVYQAAWETMAGGDPGAIFKPTLHGPLGALGYWLWVDPAIVPAAVKPDPSEWPLASPAGRFGLHVMRTGWSDEDLYFAFFAAGRHSGSYIHQHSDAGHFALAALGELFCAGRGYAHTPARYHNVLVVNGREPPNAPDFPNGESWRGGHTLAAAHGAQTDVISADLAWQWHTVWYERHAVVVRLPGAEPYVLILDWCNADNDWAFYDWQFQVQPGCRAELLPAEARAIVHGKRNRLELAWATYGAGEYPKPMQLDLRMETRRHIYSDIPSNPHHQQTVYDCLVARLSGYCGILLSALVPRRENQPACGVQRLYAPRQAGLVIDHGGCVDTVVANPQTRRLTLGGLDAEAAFAVVRRAPDGRLLAASAVDCFSLAADGRPLMPARGRAEALFEYRAAGPRASGG